jgi:hypothetical protein
VGLIPVVGRIAWTGLVDIGVITMGARPFKFFGRRHMPMPSYNSPR